VSSPRDDGEIARIVHLFANDPANQAEIDATIHGWPALSEGSDVWIQRYRDVSTPHKLRTERWDIFTTLIHETIHKLAHPNFNATFTAFGGDAQMDLREGFADMMRRDLWDGPGGLAARVAHDAPLREKVEGGVYPYDPTVVYYHNDYPQLAEAQQIAHEVGMENCKAAFFLGRTELLGAGASSDTNTPLGNVARWTPADVADAEVYVAQLNDTVDRIALKCGVDPAAVTKADGSALPAGYAPAVNERLHVAGIRYLHAIRGDTLGSLASQNGVSVNAIAAANGLPADATRLVPAGLRILIPARRA
jgi:hypothetical protein